MAAEYAASFITFVGRDGHRESSSPDSFMTFNPANPDPRFFR